MTYYKHKKRYQRKKRFIQFLAGLMGLECFVLPKGASYYRGHNS